MNEMRIVFILLFLGITSPALADTVNLRFDDLPKMVEAKNNTVLAGQSYVEGSKAQTSHWERSFLPRVRASGGGEIFQTGNSGRMTQPVGEVEGKLNLFRSGKDRLEEKILDSKVDLSKANYRQTYLRELSRARLLYADVLYYEELLKGIRQSSSLTQEHLSLIQKQIQAGLTTEADRLEFEMFGNQLQQERLLAQTDHEYAIAELKAILGLSPEMKINISSVPSQDKDLLAVKLDPGLHPEVILLEKKEEISRFQKKKANRWWAPSLDIYGGYALYPFREREYPALRNRDEVVGGIRLSMDLFDGLYSKAQGKNLEYQARGLKLEASQKTRELEILFEKLKRELKNRLELLRLINQNNGLGQKYLRMSTDEYGRGVKTGPQLLEASRRFFEERRHLAETKRDYFQILSTLSALLGR